MFAWGDNDHGQQGNGTTQVNRKPTLVHGLEGVRICRVSCGSSHSVAWTTPEPSTPAPHEPVLFPSGRDPLGTDSLAAGEGGGVGVMGAEGVKVEERRGKTRQVSLARALLSMESQAGQKVSGIGCFCGWLF